MPEKLTIEQVRKFFEEEDKEHTCTLLSTEYINCSTKLDFRCNLCGNTYQRDFNHEKRRKAFCCTACSRKRAGKKNSQTIDDVRNFINKNDVNHECTLLSTEYKNLSTPLLFKCNICGKEFKRDFAHVKRMRFRCAECGMLAGATKLEYTKEDVEEKIKESGYTIIGTYIKAAIPVKCVCSKGHEFDLRFSQYLNRGSGCPVCAIKRGKEHPNWKGGPELIEYLRKSLYSWKKQVMERDGYKCVLTGDTNFVIHHLNGFNIYVDETFNELNLPRLEHIDDYTQEQIETIVNTLLSKHRLEDGITISQKLHNEFHTIYGRGNNTKEQFVDFCKTKGYKFE